MDGPEYAHSVDTGWEVTLTDKESTAPVTSSVCRTINGQPLKSLNATFYNSKATSIDVSSFDTSQVEYMMGAFKNAAATEIIGLTSFNISNVQTMFAMFENANVSTLDLSSFDFSKFFDKSWLQRDPNYGMWNFVSDIKATTIYVDNSITKSFFDDMTDGFTVPDTTTVVAKSE